MQTVTIALTEVDLAWLKEKYPGLMTSTALIRVLVEARGRDNEAAGQTYPQIMGDLVALGPGVIHDPKQDLVNVHGVNYVRQGQDSEPDTVEQSEEGVDEDLAYTGGERGLWGVAPPNGSAASGLAFPASQTWTIGDVGPGPAAATVKERTVARGSVNYPEKGVPEKENGDKRGHVWWDDKGCVHIENMVLNGIVVREDRVEIRRYPHKGL